MADPMRRNIGATLSYNFFFFSYVAVATSGFGCSGFYVCFKRYKVVIRFITLNINRVRQEVIITREIKEEKGLVPEIQDVMQRRSL